MHLVGDAAFEQQILHQIYFVFSELHPRETSEFTHIQLKIKFPRCISKNIKFFSTYLVLIIFMSMGI